MKPFNLKGALNGAEVVTRDGRRVTQITLFDTTNSPFPLRGLVHGNDGSRWVFSWTINGAASEGNSQLDLFMPTRLSTNEVLKLWHETTTGDIITFARAIEDALEKRNS